jgi:hypothetical protein
MNPARRCPKHAQLGAAVRNLRYKPTHGREVEAKVTKIVDSVAGRKVHIAFGAFALKVDEVQIIKAVSPVSMNLSAGKLFENALESLAASLRPPTGVTEFAAASA